MLLQEISENTSGGALEALGLNFEVNLQPIYDGRGEQINGSMSVTRADTQQSLGIVGSRYRPIQNHEAFEVFDSLPNMNYVGGGMVGSKVFLVIDLGEFQVKGDGSSIRKQIVIVTSHDGTKATTYSMVPLRVFCANQIAVINDNSFLNVRHSSTYKERLSAVSLFGEAMVNQYDLQRERFNGLANIQISDSTLRDSLEMFFPIRGLTDDDNMKMTRRLNQREEVARLFHEGHTSKMESNGWRVYNAFTEYFSHSQNYRGHDSEVKNRFLEGKYIRQMSNLEQALLSESL